ncbi:hypothetical protein BR93DRAFT_964783 [Coniochaeta sp. PMI_546]|nr:hypothetical protein BR93DRAFT_964783 [Coniochaeta sp. PMI_546]
MGDIVGQASITIRASLIRLGDLAFWTPGEVADMDKGDQRAMRCWAQPQEPANKTSEDSLAKLRSQIGAETFRLDPDLRIDQNRKDVRGSQGKTASRRLDNDTLIIPLVCCYQDCDIYALCVEQAGASSEYKRLGVASMAHVEELKLRLKCGVLPEDDELDIQRQTALGRARHILESLPVSAITLI